MDAPVPLVADRRFLAGVFCNFRHAVTRLFR
jgi:hypothetical protein